MNAVVFLAPSEGGRCLLERTDNPIDYLQDRLLRGLSESVLRPEAIDYAVDRISRELQQRFESFDSEFEPPRLGDEIFVLVLSD